MELKLPGLSKRDDEDIAQAIVNQLMWNIQVLSENIKVSVEGGWVELDGEVDWDFERQAAEKSISNLSGNIIFQ